MQKIIKGSKKLKLYHLVAAALLTAISIALAPLSIYIPLFGASSLRFGLTDLPVILSGVLFGPLIGMMSGFVSDILGFIIAPGGPYFFGFTLNKMVTGFIPGFVFYYMRNKTWINQELIKKFNMILLVLSVLGGAFYLNVVAAQDLNAMGNNLPIPMTLIMTLALIATGIILCVVVGKVSKMLEKKEDTYKLHTVLFAVGLNYIIVSLIFSPIWLQFLYQIPIFASITVRLFKSLVDVPLQVMICYAVLQAIPIKIKQRILC